METLLVIAAIALMMALCDADLPSRTQPVIGVLTQPPGAQYDAEDYSKIDMSYVQWLESAGAIVVPIFFNQTEEDTRAQFFGLSGVLFTGGPDKPTDFDRYFETESLLYSLSMEHGQPLWGTCLGFQSISDIAAGGKDVLSDFNSAHMELPLRLTEDGTNSRMFARAPADIMQTFTQTNVTTNWHHYGVAPDVFNRYIAPAGFRAVSVNLDADQVPFIATMEHDTQPIYATQWHPEANQFDRDHATVTHSAQAIRAMQYLANFFVTEARTKGLGPGAVLGSTDKVRVQNYPLRRCAAGTSVDFRYSFSYVFE